MNDDSLFGYRDMTPLKTPIPAAKNIKVNRNTAPLDSPDPTEQNIKMLSQQKYMSERNAQLNPWTAFLRRENREDDPVHICVCVFVCVCVCVYSGLELGMCDTDW